VRTVDLILPPGQKLVCRSAWLIQHDGVPKQTISLWNWQYFGVSVASGLFWCTRITNKTQSPMQLALSSRDPDRKITEIALEEGTEVVFHAHKIVAILGDVSVRREWRVLNVHAWLTWQLRYLVFSGPGSLFCEGCGAIDGVFMRSKRQHLEQPLTVGFDARLLYSVQRTETFIPYFMGNAALFEDCFEGEGVFFREPAGTSSKSNPVERVAGYFFGVVGKLLGF
jgi:uncharacterized protein (AIM24 family)